MIFAKSETNGRRVDLLKHTMDVIDQCDSIALTFDLKLEETMILKICAGLHDIGKVLPSFQKTINNTDIPDYTNHVMDLKLPHNYFSIFFINKKKILDLLKNLKQSGNLKLDEEYYLKTILNAVTFHHWRENSIVQIINPIQQLRNIKREDGKMMEDEIKQALDKIEFETDNERIRLVDLIQYDENLSNYIQKNGTLLETGMITPPYLLAFLPERIQDKTSMIDEKTRTNVFYLGSLMRADHYASFCEQEVHLPDYSKSTVETGSLDTEQIIQSLKRKAEEDWKTDLNNTWQYSDFQQVTDRKKVILLAPTGSGKTEFAYLYGSGKKIIFSLPLRAAVNKMYERSIKDFGDQNSVILHSDSQIMIYDSLLKKNNGNDLSNDEITKIRAITNVSRQLGYPIQICTGDQIFPLALKYPGYERLFSVLTHSTMIIDEIQAYDPQAIAVVVSLIQQATIMGTKILLMTATLPDFVKPDLKKAFDVDSLNEITIDKYRQFGDNKKHRITVETKGLDNEQTIKQIRRLKQEGNRVLVIRNKVKNAQSAYQALKTELGNSDNLFLLHSKFTAKDRKAKENEITNTHFTNPKKVGEEGKILISTQIVEASLDIDADYLFTDIAPADSLVQRMGRVYRRYREGDHVPEEPNILIFTGKKNDSALYTGVYPKEIIKTTVEKLKQIQKDKDGVMDEKSKKEAVETVYALKNFEKTDYYKRYKRTLALLNSGYTSDTKREAQRQFRDIVQIPIIPINLKKEVRKKLTQLSGSYLNFRKAIIDPFVVGISPWEVQENDLEAELELKENYTFYYSKKHRYDKDMGLRFFNKGDESKDGSDDEENSEKEPENII